MWQARCAVLLQHLVAEVEALDAKLPGLRATLAELPARVRQAGERQNYRQAADLQDQVTLVEQEVQQAERSRAELVDRRTEADRKLREADAKLVAQVGARERATKAERRAEQRRNPSSELQPPQAARPC